MFWKWKKKKAEVASDDPTAVAKVNIDDWSEDEKHDFYQTASAISEFDVHIGDVEHGYAMGHVSTPASCPRCHAPTQQQYANLIYATKSTPRVMFTPAGHFCTACPSVVIDESLIRAGITRGFAYRGVLGLDHDDKPQPDLFKTWNGAKTVYILDEDGIATGLTTTGHSSSKGDTKQKRAADRKKQMAKASRKQNRRKR